VRSRCLAIAFLALAVAACAGAADTSKTPGASASAPVSPSPAASAATTPTPTPITTYDPNSTGTDRPDYLATRTAICKTDAIDSATPDPMDGACRGIMLVAMMALGSRGDDVIRLEAGLVCADAGCTDNVIVGFKDGHLEGAQVTRPGGDSYWAVGDFHAVAASLWPWGAAAPFAAPPVKRPALLIPATGALAKRTPLPYCGVVSGNTDTANPDARKCFANAVLTGHAAEVVFYDPGIEGGVSVSVLRFTGSGPVLGYDGQTGASGKGGTWYQPILPLIATVGKDYYLAFTPVDPIAYQ